MILKILSYNIRFGGIGRELLIEKVIRDANPDIIMFQEGISPSVIQRLAETGGYPHWSAKKNHSVACCSKIKIDHAEWHYTYRSRHPYLEVVIAGSSIRVFGVHLRAMFSNWGEKRRKREIQSLLSSIQKHQKGFHVLAGDFNSLAPNELFDMNKMPRWIRAMTWLSGREIQRQVVQLMLDNGYVDAFRTLHLEQEGYTFPSSAPRLRFDYVFIPYTLSAHLQECRVIDDPVAISASDHLPLFCQVDIREV